MGRWFNKDNAIPIALGWVFGIGFAVYFSNLISLICGAAIGTCIGFLIKEYRRKGNKEE